jgi:hypothetical protein
MTIWSELLEQDWTADEIRAAANMRPKTRSFNLALVEQPGEGADPIVGIQYACDFRAEEEYGVRDLYEAFGVKTGEWVMDARKDALVHDLGRSSGTLVLSTAPLASTIKWRDDLNRASARSDWDRLEGGAYAAWWEDQLDWLQGRAKLVEYGRETDLKMNELRDWGLRFGLTLEEMKGVRKKVDLIDLIKSQDAFKNGRKHPDRWPGWFHYGKALVLRADDGIVASVIDRLYYAGKSGTLAFGGGSQVFGSSLALYDGMDVSPELETQRKEQAAWAEKQTKKLEKAIPNIRKVGSNTYRFNTWNHSDNVFGWHFLGNPTTGFKSVIRPVYDENGMAQHSQSVTADENAVYYWLNGDSVQTLRSGRKIQPTGWYTIQELLDGTHLENAEIMGEESLRTFDDSGNYRKKS